MPQKPLTIEEFIKRAKIKHGDKFDYSKFSWVTCRTKTVIICKEHGEFLQAPETHLNSVYSCPLCIKQSQTRDKEFIQRAKEIHGDKYDYSKVNYKRNCIKVIIICKKHGEFLQTPSDHLRPCDCPKCLSSKGENLINKLLIENNIKYYHQYRFKDCRNKRPLPFDFYLPEHNICIEYDGEQHYKPSSFSSDKSVETCTANLKNIKERDNIKTLYCQINNIKLIRIPYHQTDINETLLTQIFECV